MTNPQSSDSEAKMSHPSSSLALCATRTRKSIFAPDSSDYQGSFGFFSTSVLQSRFLTIGFSTDVASFFEPSIKAIVAAVVEQCETARRHITVCDLQGVVFICNSFWSATFSLCFWSAVSPRAIGCLPNFNNIWRPWALIFVALTAMCIVVLLTFLAADIKDLSQKQGRCGWSYFILP